MSHANPVPLLQGTVIGEKFATVMHVHPGATLNHFKTIAEVIALFTEFRSANIEPEDIQHVVVKGLYADWIEANQTCDDDVIMKGREWGVLGSAV